MLQIFNLLALASACPDVIEVVSPIGTEYFGLYYKITEEEFKNLLSENKRVDYEDNNTDERPVYRKKNGDFLINFPIK